MRAPSSGSLRVPLSLAQEQLWALQALNPPGAFNELAHEHFAHPVDRGALLDALRFMVERHEVLRTSFPVAGVHPYQSITPALEIDLPITDFSHLPAHEVKLALVDVMRAEVAQPFDPAVAPLFRSRLVDLGAGGAELMVSFDHLVTDQTSLEIFRTEVRDAYDAFARGEVPVLVTLPVQYADFAVWQRSWLTDERLEEQRAYWRQKLKGVPAPMTLPCDAGAPDGQSGGPLDLATLAAVVDFAFDDASNAALRRLARDCRTTPFVVVVAAVQALLARSGGGTDIVMTTAFSGRDRAEIEGVLGMFAGIGILRTDLSADPPFEVVVQRARETVLGLLKNGDVALSRIVDDLGRDGTAFNPAAVPVDVQFFRAARDRWRPGVSVVAAPPGEGPPGSPEMAEPSKPLDFKLFDDGSQLWGRVHHHAHRFDRETVEGLVAGLEALVKAAGEDPRLRLSQLPAPK